MELGGGLRLSLVPQTVLVVTVQAPETALRPLPSAWDVQQFLLAALLPVVLRLAKVALSDPRAAKTCVAFTARVDPAVADAAIARASTLTSLKFPNVSELLRVGSAAGKGVCRSHTTDFLYWLGVVPPCSYRTMRP